MSVLAAAGSASVAAQWPGPWTGSAAGWPLALYFHHVSPTLRHYTAVSPDHFARAVAMLAERFAPLDPRAIPDVIRAGGVDRPTCLITFDDGYADACEHALPVLEQHDWPALFFVSSELVGQVEDHPVRGPLLHADWDELRELRRRGHEVASHGASHGDLSALTPAQAGADIATARAALRERLGDPPDWLAYPYGLAPAAPAAPLPELCFGSIKAPPRPWSQAPRNIRRTYLPADDLDGWEACIDAWEEAWDQSGSP
jgi:peptidoglycan/xylan/chitin deacetylase (PgdA/CDA1 family)